MIAFGCSITERDEYTDYAEPGIRRAAEPDSQIMALASPGSVPRSYNILLDWAAELDDLEALVLVHQDTEIMDPDLCTKLREAFSDPDVALVGCAGAIGVRGIAWWSGATTWASFALRYPESEFGGGEIKGMTWDPDAIPPYARTGEVDVIDGFVIGMSPWAVRELRFDESLGTIHGYDYDLCLQARAAGRKVVTADFRAIHHHSLELIREVEGWVSAHMRMAEKWEGRFEDDGIPGCDWKTRARRAEAEAEVARIHTRQEIHMREAEVAAMHRELAKLTGSTSWRLTLPLRWLGRKLRRE